MSNHQQSPEEILESLVQDLIRAAHDVEDARQEHDLAAGNPEETALAKERLRESEDRRSRLTERDVPYQMHHEMGLRHYRTSDGQEIRLDLSPLWSIPDAQMPKVREWLEEQGQEELAAQLAGPFGNTQEMRGVEAKVIGSFLRKEIERGNDDLPWDLFGLERTFIARLTK